MYNITFDDSGDLLNLTDVNEGENKAHGFSVYNLVSGLDYIWPLYKLPSGRTVAGAKQTLNAANYTNNSFHVDFPNCLLTEHGRVFVQIVATNSTAESVDEIFDAYAAGTFTGKIVKSRIYEFYANESIDALMEMASASGGISQAVRDYLDNLGAICYRRILPSDQGIDGKISNVLENAVFYCNSNDRIFTDPPTNNAYTLINTQRSAKYNLQLAFGTTAEAPYIFWRIVNRNQDAADHDTAWITVSGGGGGDVSTKMDKVNPTGSGAISVGRASLDANGNSVPIGQNSVALGQYVEARNTASVALGDSTSAYGPAAVAEGLGTEADGEGAHSEGLFTWAKANGSHAEGEETTASSRAQHVEGRYNIEDAAGTYAHIVGNGSQNNHSNAHTLDWSGNAWFSGEVRVGGSGYDSGTPLAKVTSMEIPEFVSELENDAGYITNPKIIKIDLYVPAEEVTACETGYVGGLSGGEKAIIEVSADTAQAVIAAAASGNTLYANTVNRPLDNVSEAGEAALLYNLAETQTGAHSGLDVVDAERPVWAIIVVEDDEAPGTYIMQVLSSEKIAGKIITVFAEGSYLTEHQSLQGLATETWVNTAIQNAIGNAIGGSY